MPNPLDPIWASHESVRAALKVVRRCASVPGIDRGKAFSNTRFHGLSDAQTTDLLDAAQSAADAAAVLSLYAAFEARLRDHVAGQAAILQAARLPSPAFGAALANSFAGYCAHSRMDDVADLFADTVGAAMLAQIGNIRTYRHWLAHGRRWSPPPAVTPLFAYQTLTTFLQSVGLT